MTQNEMQQLKVQKLKPCKCPDCKENASFQIVAFCGAVFVLFVIAAAIVGLTK